MLKYHMTLNTRFLKMKSRTILFSLFIVSVFASSHSYAKDYEPFSISCDDVKEVSVSMRKNPYTKKLAIGSQIRFMPEAGEKFIKHCTKSEGRPFHIVSGMRIIHTYKNQYSSLPPEIYFFDKTWEDAKAKFMAICPQRVDELPERVGKDDSYSFWIADPKRREVLKGYIPKKK